MAHAWGCSIQLWARNKHGKIQAAAEASVTINDQQGGYIASRIKQFRTSELLWTNTAEPVSQHKIEPALDTFLAAGHDVAYQLRAGYRVLSQRHRTSVDSYLTRPGLHTDALRRA